MPTPSKTQYCFEFDKSGCLRLVNNEKAVELLVEIDKLHDFAIILGAETSPANLITGCGDGKVPMPLKVNGCFNELCHTKIPLKSTLPVQEALNQALESGGGE